MDTKGKHRMQTTGRPERRSASASGAQKSEPEIEIHYTPAKPFNRNRLLLRLATVAAVVIALVLGMSIFFKARNVTVSGTEKYTPWEIKEASGIQDSDSLLSLSEARISARIRTALPYVGDVRVGIKLPDTVTIEITELKVVYAIEDSASVWWLMDVTGRIVDKTDAAAAKDYTRIVGVKIQNGVIGQQAVAAEPEKQEGTESTQATVSLTVPARQQLDAAVQVLAALEKNGVMGNVETVDVSDIRQLKLWYENRYHVTLGDTNELSYKISSMKAAIQIMGQYQNGYLDVSFTTYPDQVHHRPFEEDF